MPGPFSQQVLAATLAAGFPVRALFLPGQRGSHREEPYRLLGRPTPSDEMELPILNPFLEATVVQTAWPRSIPVYEISNLSSPEITALVDKLQPTVACVACFPRRIPAGLLELAPLGFLNVHPSLLPAYRGPVPLFWTFRNGEKDTGVTVHFMDAKLDTGDIARQAPVRLPDGISGPDADRLCGGTGGQLLAETLADLVNDTLVRRPQPEGGSYYGYPTSSDFHIGNHWPARRAFNFMRGTAEWGQIYIIDTGGERIHLRAALSYSSQGRLSEETIRNGQRVQIQFSPGVLEATIA
jgi:methionyl-tRNA formyltransferase